MFLYHVVIATIVAFFANSTLTFAQDNPYPQWQLDNKYDQKLAEFVPISKYRIRPPKEYEKRVSSNAPSGATVVTWTGKRRLDGTAAMIQVMIIKFPPNETISNSSVLMEKMLRGIKARRSSWEQSLNVSGKIGELKFDRVEWNGTHTEKGEKMYGIVFTAVDRETAVVIETQDISPHHTDALLLGTSAALTFSRNQ